MITIIIVLVCLYNYMIGYFRLAHESSFRLILHVLLQWSFDFN